MRVLSLTTSEILSDSNKKIADTQKVIKCTRCE